MLEGGCGSVCVRLRKHGEHESYVTWPRLPQRAEVDRALTPQRSLPEEPLGASSSTSWFPSSLAPEKRSTAT